MAGQAGEPVVGALEEQWGAIGALGSILDDPEWDLPSECPGWTVRDLVSHMIGTERVLLGELAPPVPDELPVHVHNPVGAGNEAWVVARQGTPGSVLVAEFEDVTGRRLDQLRAFSPDRFEEVGSSPMGPVPYREFMSIRVMDCWVHEQDIRVATGRPGHREGPVAELALGRLISAMPFVVGKQAKAPEGSSVRFDLAGPPDRRVEVVVRDGRAVNIGAEGLRGPDGNGVAMPASADTVLSMDTEVFWRLACGRVTPDAALDARLVGVQGDAELGRRVVQSMAFMI